MRWMRDLVAVLGIVTLGGGALYMQREKREEAALLTRAESDLRRIELEIKYRAATKGADLNARGWPVTIDPAWFEGHAPENPLLDVDRPWVEVAGTSQADFTHPPVRMAVDPTLASFWYNPYQGIIRARVPVMVNDEQATALYNRINGTTMGSIFSREMPPPSMNSKPAEAKPAASPDAPATQPAKEAETANAAAPASEPARKSSSLFKLFSGKKSGKSRK